MITQEELKRIINYDPDTGAFIWNVNRGSRAQAGNIVKGSLHDPKGYLTIRLNGKSYYIHRLAWLYVYGYFPENQIDHINRNPSDNRIKNLREVSCQCNVRNCGNHRDNKSGVKGVVWDKRLKKWCSYINVNRKKIYLGLFLEKNDAVLMRLAAEQCLDWAGCDSSSPAYQYAKNNGLIHETRDHQSP